MHLICALLMHENTTTNDFKNGTYMIVVSIVFIQCLQNIRQWFFFIRSQRPINPLKAYHHCEVLNSWA